MASAPQSQLPLFYKDLLPLNSRDHASWKVGNMDNAAFLADTHAVPVTTDEFIDAQRNFPIVFTSGKIRCRSRCSASTRASTPSWVKTVD